MLGAGGASAIASTESTAFGKAAVDLSRREKSARTRIIFRTWPQIGLVLLQSFGSTVIKNTASKAWS